MNKLKELIKKILGEYNLNKLIYIKKINTKYKDKGNDYSLLKCIKNVKLIKNSDKAKQLDIVLKKVKIGKINKKERFYYNIDIFTMPYIENNSLGNMSLDYNLVIKKSLKDYKEDIKNNKKEEKFCNNELKLINSIEKYIDRIISNLDKDISKNIINNIENIKGNSAKNFEEAIQRILFFNQLMWQTGHYLNGLGRLDIILEEYYVQDILNNKITKENAKEMLKEFIQKLHKDYYFKSNVINGDTGQIIEIGGTDINGEYQCNELTYMFIDVIKELQLPDPKIFLRVNSKTPRDLIEKAIDCIKTGIGCPLLANDEKIIPYLIDFGYDKEDAYNYVTSACWEPFIAGKSFDQNNEQSIVFIKPLENLLEKEELKEINSKEKLLNVYKKYLKEYLIEEYINVLNNKIYESDPLLSLLTEGCVEKNIDISKGRSKI